MKREKVRDLLVRSEQEIRTGSWTRQDKLLLGDLQDAIAKLDIDHEEITA